MSVITSSPFDISRVRGADGANGANGASGYTDTPLEGNTSTPVSSNDLSNTDSTSLGTPSSMSGNRDIDIDAAKALLDRVENGEADGGEMTITLEELLGSDNYDELVNENPELADAAISVGGNDKQSVENKISALLMMLRSPLAYDALIKAFENAPEEGEGKVLSYIDESLEGDVIGRAPVKDASDTGDRELQNPIKTDTETYQDVAISLSDTIDAIENGEEVTPEDEDTESFLDTMLHETIHFAGTTIDGEDHAELHLINPETGDTKTLTYEEAVKVGLAQMLASGDETEDGFILDWEAMSADDSGSNNSGGAANSTDPHAGHNH